MEKNKSLQNFNTENPLVSIIMPVFNAGRFLVGALDSILKQTYENWELIAVDDASSDNSFLILQHYANFDNRIKVFKNIRNLGVSKTANFAVSQSKGEFIARMDADDIMYPERIRGQTGFLLRNPRVIVVGGQVKLIDESGKKLGDKRFPLEHKKIYEMLYTAMPVQQGAMLVKRTALPKNFEWYNGVRVAEEVKLFFRLIRFGEFANLPTVVLEYRQYPQSTSLRDPKSTFRVTYNARKEAVKKYGYKPSLKSHILSYMQYLFTLFLPAPFIYPMFMLYRKMFHLTDRAVVKNAKTVYHNIERALVKPALNYGL